MTSRTAHAFATARAAIAALALVAALAGGCASRSDDYHPLNVRAPRDAKGEFHVEERPGGFTLLVEYARHQAQPDSAAVDRACRTALVAIAREIAEVRGRALKPVEAGDVDVAIRRNDATRLTWCEASVAVEYAD